MAEKTENIIIYIPFKKEDLSDDYIHYINKLQTIISISLKQIIKSEIIIAAEYNQFSGSKNQNNIAVIQLFLNNDFNTESVLGENVEFENKRIINLYCDPQTNQNSKVGLSVNLFDENSEKKADILVDTNEFKNEVWLKFLDVAYRIKELQNTGDKNTEGVKQKIYVAQTSKDQYQNREIIIRELEHLGYTVLPTENFPDDLISYGDLVHQNIKESALSIHIFGNNYSPINKNIEISGVELQNDIFIEVAEELINQNKNLYRLVWIPPDLKPKSEKQRLYIESFKRNIELLRNTEIIQAPIEVFKNIIKNRITNLIKDTEENIETEKVNASSIYVVYNMQDEAYFQEVKKEIEKQKIVVLESGKTQNKIELLRAHYQNLTNCDGIIILNPKNNRQWLNSKLSNIMKAPGFGRKKPFLFKYILHNSKDTPEFNIKINDLEIIKANGKGAAEILKPIIEKFK